MFASLGKFDQNKFTHQMGVCLKWPFPNFYIQFNKLELYTLSRTLTGEDSPPLTALNLAILQVFLAFVVSVIFATQYWIFVFQNEIKTYCCRTCGYQMLKSEIFNHSRFLKRIICICIHCSKISVFSYNQRYFLSESLGLIYNLYMCKILSSNMNFGFSITQSL